jgi:origin recognition complex subunit 2
MCFFGLGSKKLLLQEFASEWLVDGPLVVVNGYHANLNMRQIVGAIWQACASRRSKTSSVGRDLVASIHALGAMLALPSTPVPHIYLMVHSIDSKPLRSRSSASYQSQTLLAMLAAIPQIHVVASVDHVNAQHC